MQSVSSTQHKVYSHQSSSVMKCIQRRKIIVVREPGAGKTAICALTLADLYKKSVRTVLWISPAHLINQSIDEVHSWASNLKTFVVTSKHHEIGSCNFISYSMLRKHSRFIEKCSWDVVVADEFHRAKNELTKTHGIMKSLLSNTDRFIGITGTPFQNNPYELFSLVGLLAGKIEQYRLESCLQYRSPRSNLNTRFLMKFGIRIGGRPNQGPITGVQNPSMMRAILTKYIDYRSPESYIDECSIPVTDEHIKYVTLTSSEEKLYGRLEKQYRRKNDYMFRTDTLADEYLNNCFNRMHRLREFLISHNGILSSKSNAMINHIVEKCKYSKIVVFTNFVELGVDVICKDLDHRGVKASAYTGKTSKADRERIVSQYQNKDTNVLVVSPVGHEGLNIDGTTEVLILDPHYNPEREKQMIARATRANSSLKSVQVTRYISVRQDEKKSTIDQSILRIASRKRKVNSYIESIMSTV